MAVPYNCATRRTSFAPHRCSAMVSCYNAMQAIWASFPFHSTNSSLWHTTVRYLLNFKNDHGPSHTERERERVYTNTDMNVLMTRPSVRVIVGHRGWGNQQLLINNHQSVEWCDVWEVQTHTHSHAHTHARTHARTHACTHGRTHARMYARTHARTLTHSCSEREGRGTYRQTVYIHV